ncbi:CAMK family protein kinase [Trichomonas vaginalis G3]|uniref:CAMK family protein kinase n=1 Tax=Trichomonas vaginalis (strain ATCC PRA-98 / G3) TaxID=412133 RepID=A2EID8_TRIV3|nr:protein serine/threonine kinase protein [Trichomonas vaginalis G3]EAY07620.1 CAMK family protein kinase [Trichomonas vaginalis G3]KAI5502494.1 protein serine/threonine kinase protein [Trichomonas vaginalis G3]|eukprot:XP_001319843.1 CAMK family protein kinase [Trichomonas vaginalis G3]
MISPLPCSIHKYGFKKLIGKGGFSFVYLVESEDDHKKYCAKVTPLNNDIILGVKIDPLEAEIKALMSLSHQNIIRLYDHFTENNCFFIILEYCQLGSMQDTLNKKGLPKEQFINYARQIVSALTFVHSKNIAHRDIKPGNILIDSLGHIKLSDFGISITNANNMIEPFSGSLLYMPPEIILKKPHNPMQADIWSLGVLFAYMINGRAPWQCDNVNSLRTCIIAGDFKLRANTPPEIIDLISKMMRIDPNERPSVAEILNYKLFEKDPLDGMLSDNEEVPQDVLSPKGRSLRSIQRNKSTYHPHSITIGIFKMNMMLGNNRLPRIKPRFHHPFREKFATH